MRRALLLLCVAWPGVWPALAWGQADPAALSDIRGQIATLAQEIQGLRGELTASGQLTQGVAGNTPLERLNAIEAELQRLTSRTEELEFRINRVVTDGTNRLGDLQFRVCELEEGCDVSQLGDTPALGGTEGTTVVPAEPVAPVDPGPALAVNEGADFERAEGALASGDFQGAADLFAAFVAAYPGSPLMPRAHLGRGAALDGLGDASNAARAYLDSFSSDPSGAFAADALLGLGRNLGTLGQVPDACVTLAEIGTRFPASALVGQAQAEARALGCP
ncbi:tetratricopeptide repeat protein [Rubellimicrobium aerolatum]|uniref:Tetratricopeptide repeat protein n=1 Tax=Rubellimicrobium aerolatum TaxID=490979 RepID=A0ABW0SFI6_9RHOB|nr:tetratricopeptide repeat protein [Rubellimicrobium aerolatum]MBP1807118.1 tol-pal system protein YbgF [Rubellimicrobium aerolatum]